MIRRFTQRQLLVTGRRDGGRAEVVLAGKAHWVTAAYLSDEKPAEPEPADSGSSLGGQCTNGTSIDAGRQSLYDIYNAVCSNWPQVTSYGTWRSDGKHGQGSGDGHHGERDDCTEVRQLLRVNYAAGGIKYLTMPATSGRSSAAVRAGGPWRTAARSPRTRPRARDSLLSLVSRRPSRTSGSGPDGPRP